MTNTPSLPPIIHTASNQPLMITKAKAGVFKPRNFHSKTSTEPKSYKTVMQYPGWLATMQQEYQAPLDNKTWVFTPLPHGATLIGCKWIFRNKFNVDGTFLRHKARLVAKRFQQNHGFDYTETFSPSIQYSCYYFYCYIQQMANSSTRYQQLIPLWRSCRGCVHATTT